MASVFSGHHILLSLYTKARLLVGPIKLRRTRTRFIFGAHIEIPHYEISKDAKTIRGLPSTLVDIKNIAVPQRSDGERAYSEIVVPEYFPPGSIMLFETQQEGYDPDLDKFCASGALEAFGYLELVDLNVVLYRADNEERDATQGEFGAYEVPGLGKLVYCGLEGWIHPLKHIMRYNDLGHPLCSHLRDGIWAFDYIHARLEW